MLAKRAKIGLSGGMKLTSALLAGFFVLALPGTLSAQALALGDSVSATGVFSYEAPAGLDGARHRRLQLAKSASDKPKNGFAANINVVVQPYLKPLADYVAFNKDQVKKIPMLQNVLIIDEKPFTTVGGLAGTRHGDHRHRRQSRARADVLLLRR